MAVLERLAARPAHTRTLLLAAQIQSLRPLLLPRNVYPRAISRTTHTSTALRNNGQPAAPGDALQLTDLLELYRGLVARGDIAYDNDQIRVIMRLRRLSKSLENYVPNLISGHAVPALTPHGTSWWTPQHPAPEEKTITPSTDSRALLLRKDAAREMEELPFPKGVILIAPPGRGKTFLLDMWFSSLPTKHKVRKHYSTLVLEMYRAVWEETQHRTRVARAQREAVWTPASVAGRVKWSAKIKQQWKALFAKGDMSGIWDETISQPSPSPSSNSYISPLPISQTLAARLLLRQGYLLHIDELQLLDIGSATILSDVLAHYWRMGGVVVATSNKVPGELYKNGLGAERVRGFVSALEARCDVVRVGGEVDWRRVEDTNESAEVGKGTSWFMCSQEEEFEQAAQAVIQGRQSMPMTLSIFSRSFHIPTTYASTHDLSLPLAAKISFDELCNTALGTADYTTLASTFSTLIITDIPVLRLATKDRARRFISLVDALYEARVRIVCLAEAEIDGLFFPDELSGSGAQDEGNERTMMEEALSESSVVYRPNVSAYEPPTESKQQLKKQVAGSFGKEGLSLKELSIFTGQEEKFAYARATSRLIQMTSTKYAATAVWQPLTRAQQPWHVDLPSSPSSSSPTPKFAVETPTPAVEGRDWAEEASYDAQRRRSGRPEPPRLSENHAWGVRDDWGKGAGEWGKGVSGTRKT